MHAGGPVSEPTTQTMTPGAAARLAEWPATWCGRASADGVRMWRGKGAHGVRGGAMGGCARWVGRHAAGGGHQERMACGGGGHCGGPGCACCCCGGGSAAATCGGGLRAGRRRAAMSAQRSGGGSRDGRMRSPASWLRGLAETQTGKCALSRGVLQRKRLGSARTAKMRVESGTRTRDATTVDGHQPLMTLSMGASAWLWCPWRRSAQSFFESHLGTGRVGSVGTWRG